MGKRNQGMLARLHLLDLLFARRSPICSHINVITASHLKGLPGLNHLPEHMRPLFDNDNKTSFRRNSILLTSYETWGERSTYKVVVKSKAADNTEISHFEWRTRLQDCTGDPMLDEGHRAKNQDSRTHASTLLLRAQYTWIVSTTPMLNDEKVDLLLQNYFYCLSN